VTLPIPDSLRIPAREGRSAIRERASRFLGLAFRSDDVEHARERIQRLGKEYHDATHVCFAWRIGASVRAADAGEPAGTAGKPILSAIDASGLDRVAVAVVRYFGGTKLGTAGLVCCYRAAAHDAIEDAGSEIVLDVREIEIETGFDRVAAVKRLIDPPDVTLVTEDFTDRARFRVAVRESRLAGLERALGEARLPFRRVP